MQYRGKHYVVVQGIASSSKASSLIAGNGPSIWTNKPPDPEKPKPEDWPSAPSFFWSTGC
jgi:hypothetical protein